LNYTIHTLKYKSVLNYTIHTLNALVIQWEYNEMMVWNNRIMANVDVE